MSDVQVIDVAEVRPPVVVVDVIDVSGLVVVDVTNLGGPPGPPGAAGPPGPPGEGGGAEAPLVLTSPDAASVPLTLVGDPDQAADLFDVVAGWGDTVAAVDCNGTLIVGAITGPSGSSFQIDGYLNNSQSLRMQMLGSPPGGTMIGGETFLGAMGQPVVIGNQFPDLGGGEGPLVVLAEVHTPPTVASSVGGILFVEGGALKYMGGAGTVTTIAPA